MQKQTLRNIIEERYKKTASRDHRVQRMLAELDEEINTIDDMEVFILTCENIMLPLQQAISNIPSDDREFTLNIAKSYLDIQGEEGLATVITLWDDLGVKGCLTAERTEIVRAFTTLRVLLTKDKSITEEDRDIVLTAFTQEFERRAAQKRKKRAGGSLEDVTDFILGYYKIKRAEAPSHFQADLEVDNWVKAKDGWLIGISCKRTIRERWKNVSSSTEVYNRFKVKYIFHVVTFDEDLSDDKLTLLGEQRQIFYLPDNSRRLKYASEHVGLKNYVRPISQLINDLRKELK
ncbi:MAG: hypothetical protein EOM44_07980 [Bacteroidia bacterium]|nr:hypothetical protein [Bacteroidia bacterium]